MHRYAVFNVPIRPTACIGPTTAVKTTCSQVGWAVEGMGVGPKIHHPYSPQFLYTYFISLYTFLSTKLHILHSFYNTRILLYLYTFLSTKLHILHSFYTRILLYLYLCSVFCTFISGLFSFPMKHLSLLNLPNYSNSQFTNPFYHPNIH